jgi:hypothetical protein
MKISQHNWNFWFVSTIIVMMIGFMGATCGKTANEIMVSNIIMVIGLISFIPCLYFGTKPTDN